MFYWYRVAKKGATLKRDHVKTKHLFKFIFSPFAPHLLPGAFVSKDGLNRMNRSEDMLIRCNPAKNRVNNF